MISYKQSEAKEEAVKLAYELTGNKDDVWLDINKEDKSVAAMKEAVRGSEVFLCILTPSYFKSEYCLNELKWAREFEKPIVSCYPQDENVGEILSSAPKDVAFISTIDSKGRHERSALLCCLARDDSGRKQGSGSGCSGGREGRCGRRGGGGRGDGGGNRGSKPADSRKPSRPRPAAAGHES